MVKTAASHAANGSSTLPRVTIIFDVDMHNKVCYSIYCFMYIVGVDWGEGPPVPIPNTEVKLISAENTCRVTDREDR